MSKQPWIANDQPLTRPLSATRAQRRQVFDWARAAYPDESCGLLLGILSDASVEVHEVQRATNLAPEQTNERYELDPHDFLQADRRARDRGWSVLGVWHSHPDHPPRPSETDWKTAWPDFSYLIVAVDPTGAQGMLAWRLREGRFHEEPIRFVCRPT